MIVTIQDRCTHLKEQEYDGKLSFATDAWTSPNHKAYVAVTAHLENDGVPLSMLLDIVEVARSHSGINLAIAFAEILETFGVKDKVRYVIWNKKSDKEYSPNGQILSITADNASNNDTMVDHLGEILDEFPGASNQTRCFAHTISISAKAILKQFDIPKTKAGEHLDQAAHALAELAKDLDLDERVEQETQARNDNEDDDQPLDAWVDFREGMTAEQLKELDESVKPVRSMLVKVC